jgi:hypothetical protein
MVVAQLGEALRYKPEGRGFDSQWSNWEFSFTKSFRQHYDPGVNSDSNRNKYQKYFIGGQGGLRRADNLSTFRFLNLLQS